MPESKDTRDWRRGVVGKAKAEIRALPRPDGCTAQRWHCVVRLLEAMAEYLPDPFPRQRSLATRLEVDVATIKRWVKWAVELGVLEVSKESYHGYWNHNTYGISTGSQSTTRTRSQSAPLSSPYLRMEKGQKLPSVAPGKDELSAASGVGDHVVVSDYDASFSETDTDRSDLKPAQSKGVPKRRTKTTQVTAHFEEAWDRVLAQPGGRYLSMTLLFDSKATFQTRVKIDLLDKGRTVEDVNASIDAFLQDVLLRRVTPKPGQPLWKLWWGRRSQYQRQAVAPDAVVRHSLDDLERSLDAPDTEA